MLHLGFRMVSQFVVQLRALKNLLPVFLVLRDGLVKHRGFMIWFGSGMFRKESKFRHSVWPVWDLGYL